MGPKVAILIFGGVNATGTFTNPITFINSNATANFGSFKINGNLGKTPVLPIYLIHAVTTLFNCVFHGGGSADTGLITISSPFFTISNVTINNSSSYGIYSTFPVVADSLTISNCLSIGIFAYGVNLTNSVLQNCQLGIYVEDYYTAQFVNTQFISNQLGALTEYSASVIFLQCSFMQNQQAFLLNYHYGYAGVINCTKTEFKHTKLTRFIYE